MITISIIFSIVPYHLPLSLCSSSLIAVFPSASLPYALPFALTSSLVARGLILFHCCTQQHGLDSITLRNTKMFSVRQEGEALFRKVSHFHVKYR